MPLLPGESAEESALRLVQTRVLQSRQRSPLYSVQRPPADDRRGSPNGGDGNRKGLPLRRGIRARPTRQVGAVTVSAGGGALGGELPPLPPLPPGLTPGGTVRSGRRRMEHLRGTGTGTVDTATTSEPSSPAKATRDAARREAAARAAATVGRLGFGTGINDRTFYGTHAPPLSPGLSRKAQKLQCALSPVRRNAHTEHRAFAAPLPLPPWHGGDHGPASGLDGDGGGARTTVADVVEEVAHTRLVKLRIQ